MEITDILQWIPMHTIIVVFTGTYAAKRMFIPKGEKASRKFLLVPFGLGFCFTYLWYFNMTDPEIIREMPVYLRILRPTYQAVFGAFASIGVWEWLWKRYLAKKFGDMSDPPTIPPGSALPLEPKP